MNKLFSFLALLLLPASLWAQDKGTFASGFFGSFRSWNAQDGMDFLGIVTGADGKAAKLSAGLHADWFFMDNLSLVATAEYSSVAFDGNSANIAGLLSISNKHTRSENYMAALGVRKYMPLFGSRIFALFGEGRICASRGYSKNYSETERGKEGTYSDLYSADIQMVSGLSVFLMERMALQVSIPVGGVGYEWEKQTEAQVKNSSFTSLAIYSDFDLLQIKLGISYLF